MHAQVMHAYCSGAAAVVRGAVAAVAMQQPCRGRAARLLSHSQTLEIDALRARASFVNGKVVQSTRTGGGGAYHSRRTRARAYGRVREVPPTGLRPDRPGG